MKILKNIIFTVLVLFGLSTIAQSKQSPTLIVFNAKVHTLDNANTIAEAIAVQNGKIIKVGKSSSILKLKTKNTKLVDAKGKTIVPGIFDSHMHIIRGGRFYNTELRWDGVRSLKRALTMLKEQAQRTPDGHAYLNKAGLTALNINAETPSPKGGLVQKDEMGNPTGLLVAEPNAYLLYATLAKLPELTDEQKTNSTQLFMSEMNRLGVTSIMDAGGGFQNYPDDYGITDLLAKEDKLTIRLPFYLFAQKPGSELIDYTKWISEVEIGEHDDHKKLDKLEYYVQGGGENLVASAGDFENFDKPRPDLSPEMEGQLKAVIGTLVKNRWPFRLHATYNESITRFLNVIEEVNGETPLNGLLWFFDHAETISEENLVRIKALGGSIAIQHRMAYQAESFIKRYGKKAAENTPPVKKMLDLGITVGMGSDGTRVSSFNPWIGLYWLTTGKSIGETKHQADKNVLDRTTALKLFTQGSAKLVRLDADRGMIKENYLADFIVLSDDYFSVADRKIQDITANLTVVDGKIVYADEVFQGLAKPLPKAIPEWSPVNFYGGYQKK